MLTTKDHWIYILGSYTHSCSRSAMGSDLVAQGFIQYGLKNFQNLAVSPVTIHCLTVLMRKSLFYFKREPLIFQLMPIVSSFSHHASLWEVWFHLLDDFLIVSREMLLCSPKLTILQAEQDLVHQLLSLGKCSNPDQYSDTHLTFPSL